MYFTRTLYILYNWHYNPVSKNYATANKYQNNHDLKNEQVHTTSYS